MHARPRSSILAAMLAMGAAFASAGGVRPEPARRAPHHGSGHGGKHRVKRAERHRRHAAQRRLRAAA
jgi:hypothetical protein